MAVPWSTTLATLNLNLLRDWACGGFRRAFGRMWCTCERAHSSDPDALHTGRTHSTTEVVGGLIGLASKACRPQVRFR